MPLLPLVWFVAPGLWRNVCPLAATNQIPRVLGFTRGRTAPPWFRTYAPLAGIAIFLAAVFARPTVFEDDGAGDRRADRRRAVAAFAGGYLLKGKSGWCSSLCPMLPVQRMYGQTPFANVPNSHCRPCLGCTKNCFDFNPKVAFLADVHDGDRQWSTTRKLFTAAFPGLVIAFFTEQDVAVMALAVGASAGSFLALEALLPATHAQARRRLRRRRDQPLLLVGRARARTGSPGRCARPCSRSPSSGCGGRSPRSACSSSARACRRRRGWRRGSASARAPRCAPPQEAEVTFEEGGPRIVAKPGTPLLELAETAEQPIEAGCRMGVCGADPVCVLAGMENLSPVGERRAGDARAARARPRAQPHGLLRPRPRPRDGVDDPAPRLQRRRRDRLPVRPRRRARGRDRQRHRGRHRRRPRPPPPPGLRDRRRRRRAAPALQPHGHLAADLRALGDGRPAPAAGRLVRRQPHHLLAQHARAGDRPRGRRGACSAPASGCRSTG